jgi:serine/threonine protein kinase
MPKPGKSTLKMQRLRQVLAEFEHRRDGDFPIEPEELIADHPDIADELRAHFGMGADQNGESARATTSVGLASPGRDSRDGNSAETIAPSRMAKSTPSLPTGKEFGRYVLERQLGKGAMGAVYLARDSELGRKVALKIPTFSPEEAEYQERFYREARAAAVLSHANLCQVFDIGEHDGTLFITMTFVDGQPLSRHIGMPKFSDERFIARLLRKIALGLQHAHENGIIHRDLKPGNILIDKKGEPFVTDFGLARKLDPQAEDRLTQEGTIVGTPAYMPAEQIEDSANRVGPRSDIYSLGVILYEMLTGELPFSGPVMAVIGKILRDNARPPSDIRNSVSPQLESICLKMMARSADDRYGSMKEVADALAGFIREARTAVIPPTKSAVSKSAPEIRRPARKPARVKSLDQKPLPNPTATPRKKSEIALPDWIRNSHEHWKLLAGGATTIVLGLMLWSVVSSRIGGSRPDEPPGDGPTVGAETVTTDGTGEETKPVTPVHVPRDTGEVSLFNGFDLTGWMAVGDSAAWRVDDGVLISDSGERGVLWSNKSYSDFEFSFRFRMGARANSGIYLRSAGRTMVSGGNQLEIQLLDDQLYPTQPGNGRTGAIFGIKEPEFRAYRPERWNEMTIRLAGRLIEVTLNGHQIQNASLDNVTRNFSKQPGLKRPSGYIGVQTYGAGIDGKSRIEFADLRIIDLNELPDAAPGEIAPENVNWSIPVEFTDARPVSEINRGDSVNAYVSLSEDGLEIYWTREGSRRKSEIRTASRPHVGAPFGASTRVLEGRHGVVAAGGRYIICLGEGENGAPALVESFRESKSVPFPPPKPVFTESRVPKSPSLSNDGMTVVFQRSGANPGNTHLVIGTRSRYDLPWAGPWTIRLNSPAWMSDQITWPFLSEDRRTLIFCNGGGRDPKLIRATRTDEQSAFETFEQITVDGLDIIARAPHYVYRTRELYYSVPVTKPAGSWEIWRARAK